MRQRLTPLIINSKFTIPRFTSYSNVLHPKLRKTCPACP